MVTMRDPNSTPIVKSCTRWNRLSVNCSSKHDLPTPVERKERERKSQSFFFFMISKRLYNCLRFFRFPNKALTRIADDNVFKQVRVAHGFLSSFKMHEMQ